MSLISISNSSNTLDQSQRLNQGVGSTGTIDTPASLLSDTVSIYAPPPPPPLPGPPPARLPAIYTPTNQITGVDTPSNNLDGSLTQRLTDVRSFLLTLQPDTNTTANASSQSTPQTDAPIARTLLTT